MAHVRGFPPHRFSALLFTGDGSLRPRPPPPPRESDYLRGRILDIVQREPGISPSRLVKELSIGWSSLYRHLRSLEAGGLVRVVAAGRHAFVYLASAEGDPRLVAQRAVLLGGKAYAVAAEVARTSGHHVESLARALNLSQRLVYHHVRRLVDAGLLTSTVPNRYRDLAPTARLVSLLREMPPPEPSASGDDDVTNSV